MVRAFDALLTDLVTDAVQISESHYFSESHRAGARVGGAFSGGDRGELHGNQGLRFGMGGPRDGSRGPVF